MIHHDLDLNPIPTLKFMLWQQVMRREIPPPEFIIDGLVPLRGVTLVTGEGGIGKSFMLMEMAYAVASGTDFLGRFACEEGGVVVIDLENDDTTLVRRAQKIQAAHRQASGHECIVESDPGVLCLGNKGHKCDHSLYIWILSKHEFVRANLLIDRMDGYQALDEIVKFYTPTLLIIDPLTAIHSTDENDNIAMRQVIMQLQQVARDNHTAVVVVHHPRKRGMVNDAGQMIRGASDLRNAVDSHLFLRKLSDTNLLIEHDKSRHAPPVERFKVEMVDTEDGAGTIFRYVGEAADTAVKQAGARESILSLLNEAGTCKRGELVARAKMEGISRTVLDRELKWLIERGQVGKLDYGVYGLKQPQLDVGR